MISSTNKLTGTPEMKCKCYVPPIFYGDYHISFLGTDNTNGRFADVTIETCIFCGIKWIKYLVEYESHENSGRWYRGVIANADVKEITPEGSVEYLENQDWYIFGGSYFNSGGIYGKGKLQVDL